MIHTPRRRGDVFQMPVARGAVIEDGTIVVSDAGYARPGRLAPGLIYLGRADSSADDSEEATGVPGGTGKLTVLVRRDGWFQWDSVAGADAITQADVGKTAYIHDDRTVTRNEAGASPAGLIIDVDEEGVWVEGGTAAATPSGAGLTLVHSPLVSPVVTRLAPVTGEIQGTVVLDISDISNFTAISDGSLMIGATLIDGIDLSGAASINDVVNTISAAVQLALPTYTVTLGYVNPNFYGAIRRSDGDVPTIAGTLEPLFGFEPPRTRRNHSAASPNIVLPGSWSHLQFRFLGQSYRTQYWYSQSDFWLTEGQSLSQYLAFNNSGGWRTSSFNDPNGGALTVAVMQAYNVDYISIQYDPATGVISWTEETAQPGTDSWAPSIDTLTVLGS